MRLVDLVIVVAVAALWSAAAAASAQDAVRGPRMVLVLARDGGASSVLVRVSLGDDAAAGGLADRMCALHSDTRCARVPDGRVPALLNAVAAPVCGAVHMRGACSAAARERACATLERLRSAGGCALLDVLHADLACATNARAPDVADAVACEAESDASTPPLASACAALHDAVHAWAASLGAISVAVVSQSAAVRSADGRVLVESLWRVDGLTVEQVDALLGRMPRDAAAGAAISLAPFSAIDAPRIGAGAVVELRVDGAPGAHRSLHVAARTRGADARCASVLAIVCVPRTLFVDVNELSARRHRAGVAAVLSTPLPDTEAPAWVANDTLVALELQRGAHEAPSDVLGASMPVHARYADVAQLAGRSAGTVGALWSAVAHGCGDMCMLDSGLHTPTWLLCGEPAAAGVASDQLAWHRLAVDVAGSVRVAARTPSAFPEHAWPLAAATSALMIGASALVCVALGWVRAS